MIKELQIKFYIEGHDYVELAYLNEKCKANRVYCHECLRNGDHVAHIKDQKNLKELIEFFYNVEQENGILISELSLIFGEIIKLFEQLKKGLEQKYQFSKERLLGLNAKQLNSALDQVIKFDEFKKGLFDEIKKFSDDMIISLKIYITELKIEQVYYIQSNQQEQVEQLYQKGNPMIYQGYKLYVEGKYKETIKLFDVAFMINPKHFNSLYIKADSLSMLGNHKDAIIWADKALSIDSNHVNSLFTKADSLNMLGNNNDAIIWADKNLSIDSNHVNSLITKGDSLTMLGKYKEALTILYQVLNLNPNHDTSLEAIIFYNKAIQINPDYQWAKNYKAECEKQLKLKK
ncbi:unnamed protein product [Paramecium pentaurelia]|uniref:Tetratricopeptide repeat protein n=1 Tax=Paramecium pentaurelia TaxID=43138 RepID=A0A8S1YFJ2_9CILI|nr:unnamed protein product [Paramecium pentaurelia]